MRGPLIYLAGISLAEVLVTLSNPLIGIFLHTTVLIALLVHAALVHDRPIHKLYSGLSLAPMIRILSLSMPLTNFPLMYWYGIIGVPLLIGTFVAVRVLGYSFSDIGLNVRRLPLQVLIALVGFPLGVVEYLVLRPNALVATPSFEAIWLPALILLVGTGFSEELIFRGVLQKAALEWMPAGAIIYVSVLFAILHVGYGSVPELFFVAAVGLIFAVLVRRTGSLLGTTFAHGFLNITLFLLVPLWGLSVWETIVPNLGFATVLGAPTEARTDEEMAVAEITPELAEAPAGATELPAAAVSSPSATATAQPSPAATAQSSATATHTPTVLATATPSATARPSVTTGTPARGVVVAGTQGRGLRIRSTPSTSAVVLSVQMDGTAMQMLGDVWQAESFTWWKVQDPQNRMGWAISDNLQLTAAAARAPIVSPTAASVVPTATPLVATASSTPSTDVSSTAWMMSYIVQPGDTLSTVAQRFGTTSDVLIALNGLQSQIVVANQRLRVPSQPVIVYVVKSGDTLGSIATGNGTSVSRIVAMNTIADINIIVPGQRLIVPLSR